MFASLSSFLPSALQPVSQGARTTDAPDPPDSAPPDAPTVDPPRKKEKREKREKHANEAFIIVRPPPSTSTQPLSLQVQLVPPQSRHGRPLQALDPSPDDLSTDLQRTHSHGSEASGSSGYTSTGSVSSFSSSTSTSSSARRTIIPLYNLNVHSVMPTTILDAGTDAKVAKFAKRGLEVIGLAFLEPIEIRSSTLANGSFSVPITIRVSLDDSLRELGTTPTLSRRRPASPNRPHTSHATPNMLGDHPRKPIINLTPAPLLPPPDQQPQRSTKNLFAKVFRRKGAPTASPLSIAVPTLDDIIDPQPSPTHSSAHCTDDAPASNSDTSHHLDTWSSTPLMSTIASQSAILGVHATLYPPISNPRGRPTKYIWIVRKWLKGADTGILNGMMGKLNVGTRDANVSNTPHTELRFEWSREKKKRNGRKSRADKSSNSRDGHSPTRHRPPANTLPRFATSTLSPDAHDHRSSIISHHSSGSDTATSLASSAQRPEESDEESDPEDSETPWTCTVTVQRLGQSRHDHQKGVQEHPIRLKVATLAPTPHHPKVVGLLKMPFPLPDIEVERLVVCRRVVTAQGVSKTTAPNTGELILTAEEIKDAVSSTALWLVVREAFGGVGRERKKGKS